MEKETGAKIIIRGKGSVKEGKVGRKDGQPLPGEDEPLHAFITASNPEHVQKAVAKIKEVINQGIDVPEGHNDLRRMQLRELAQLNGTLRETDQPRCSNCGSTDHKSWLCSDKPNVTNNIVCSACGGAGHISKDCRSKRPGMGGAGGPMVQTKIDEEYLSLMAELGEAPPPEANQSNSGSGGGGHHGGPSHTNRIGGSIFDSRQNHQPRAIMGSNNQMPPWSHNNNSGQHHYHQQQQQQQHHHHQQHQQQQQHHHQQAHYQQPQHVPNPAIQPLLAWNQPPPPGMSHNGADHPPAPPGNDERLNLVFQ
jgi:splicing factor 1